MAHRKFEHDQIFGIVQAWHGLSTVQPDMTFDDKGLWLREWDYEALPLFYANGTQHDHAQLTFRAKDGAIVPVGAPFNPETFTPLLNADFLALVEKAIEGTGHKLASYGSVRNRGRVFLSFELKGMEKFQAAGRTFSAFLNFGNGNDKSSVLWANTSNICTVCDNTFSFNLAKVETARPRDGSQMDETGNIAIRKKHTKNLVANLPMMAAAIDQAIGVQAEFALAMDTLADVKCTESKAREFFAGFVAPSPKAEALSTRARNTADRLTELFLAGRGNRGESLADVFQAATEYYTHESSGGDNRAKQFVSSEFGAGADRKSEVWEILNATEKAFGKVQRVKFNATAKHGEKLLAAATTDS